MKKLNIILTLALATTMQILAHEFRTAELERLATTLSLDAKTLPEGYSHMEAKGIMLTAHKTGGTVDLIGKQLFSDEVRSTLKTPILDFLERYFLQLQFPPQVKTANMMVRDDEFHFLKGNMNTIDRLRLTDDFAYSFNHRRYEATWSRDGITILSVSFPVEYQLISGENKIEAENNLMSDIEKTKFIGIPNRLHLVENATYLTKDFSNRLYRQNDTLVLNTVHPIESVANMMLSLEAANNFRICITQVSYGFKKTVFCVPLQQWIAFCHENGCELYFGFNQFSSEGDIDAVVLAVNEQENYNHVLSVHIPGQAVEERTGEIAARLYPYVPTHNVKNLFAAYKKSTPKSFEDK